MSKEKLRLCLNGCNSKVTLKGIFVYHNWDTGESYDKLGQQLQKVCPNLTYTKHRQ